MTLPSPLEKIDQKEFIEISDDDFYRLSEHIDLDQWREKKIFVTGCTGFFGAWLLALFDWITRQDDVRLKVFALSRDPSEFMLKHSWIQRASWIEWIQGDIRDFEFPNQKLDFIIHAATDASAAAGEDPLYLLSSMIDGTKRVFSCAKECEVSRILLVSSGAAYGVQPAGIEEIEESSLTAPSTMNSKSAYGEGKRVMELLGSIYAEKTGVNVSVARCFAFVGAGLPLDKHFAVGNFIHDALASDALIVSGDGSAERSYLYMADLAIWLLTILANGESGKVYNVGSDKKKNMREIAKLVAEVLSPSKSVIVKGVSGLSPVGNRYVPSIEAARSLLALDAWTPLNMAIKNTAIWAGN